jgi:hypothetical protein
MRFGTLVGKFGDHLTGPVSVLDNTSSQSRGIEFVNAVIMQAHVLSNHS